MSTALIGIIALQVYWISKAIRINDAQFDKQVYHAMLQVAARLEQEEMNRYVVFATNGMQLDMIQGKTSFNRRLDTINARGPHGREQMRPRREMHEEQLRIRIDGHMNEEDTMLWIKHFLDQHEDSSLLLEQEFRTVRNWASRSMFPGSVPDIEQMLTRSLQFIISPQRGLRDRLSQERLDSLLGEMLKEAGINLKYQYLVYNQPEGGYIYKTANAKEEDLLMTPYRSRLYPNARMSQTYLFVDFPNRGMYAWGEVWGVVLASLLFTGIILFSFLYVVKTILRQKKLSEMKSDFINNMTHEFKTPLATISLATDALRSPMIRGDEERMNYYTRIIKEENQRMNMQVERVLQIARSEIKLRPVSLNVNDIIEKAVENIRLHVEQRDGQVDFVLDAENPIIEADEVHLTNLISNLLDNANKYSPQAPMITVSSWEEEGWMAISISDKGQGISKSDQEKIFERFFRVSTGNLHDVKGFGLGLSYVKEIVEAHGGLLSLESKLGEGSTFIVRLPR